MEENVKNNENKVGKTKKDTKIKKESSFFRDNKKTIVVAIIALAVVIVAILLAINIFGDSKTESNKEKLEKRVGELLNVFYANYYSGLANSNGERKTDEEKVEFAKRFEQTGIKFPLESIIMTFTNDKEKEPVNNQESITNEFKNDKGEACDLKNSRVIIYPTSPYGEKDYRYEVELECGF